MLEKGASSLASKMTLGARHTGTGLCLLLLVAACTANDPPKSNSANRELGLVAVVAAPPADAMGSRDLNPRKSKAISGAAGGAQAGVGLVRNSGGLGVLFLPAIPILAIIGGIGGSIVDGVNADSIAVTRKAMTEAQQEFFAAKTPAESLSDALFAESAEFSGYRMLRLDNPYLPKGSTAGPAVDTVALTDAEWRFYPSETSRSKSFLEIRGSVNLSGVGDVRSATEHQITARRGPYSFQEWGEANAQRFRDALRSLQEEMARNLFAEAFAIYRAPPAAHGVFSAPAIASIEEMAVPFAGFRPLQPEYRITAKTAANYPGGQDQAQLYWVETPTLDSRMPLLSWEAWPGSIQADPFVPAESLVKLNDRDISNVTYDLAVSCPEYGPAYVRRDLSEPHHRVEQPLPADQKCIWSVRARFVMGGRTRITDWSRPLVPIGLGWRAYEARRGNPEGRPHSFNFYTPEI